MNDKDWFAGHESHVETTILTLEPEALTLDSTVVRFPNCIKGTILHKAIAYDFMRDIAASTKRKNLGGLRRIFESCTNFELDDEILLLDELSKCIQRLTNENGTPISASYVNELQRLLLGAAERFLRTDKLSRSERKILEGMIEQSRRFRYEERNARKTIAELLPDCFNYTNKQIVESIRYVALEHLVACVRIRERFKLECPSLYAELLELSKQNTDLHEATILYTQHSRNMLHSEHSYNVLKIYLEAAVTLEEPLLLESIFLFFSRVGVLRETLQNGLSIAWKSHVNLDLMKSSLVDLMNDFTLITKAERSGTGKPWKFWHPSALIYPSPDELDSVLLFFATERLASSSMARFSVDHIRFLDSSGSQISSPTSDLITACNISIQKVRAGKTYDSDIYKKNHSFFKYLRNLSVSYDALKSEGFQVITKYPLRQHFTSLQGQIKNMSALCEGLKVITKVSWFLPLAITNGFFARSIHSDYSEPFLKILQKAALDFSSGNFHEWKSPRYFLPITAISQARVASGALDDLSNYTVSDNLEISYSKNLYSKLESTAEREGHSVATRVNKYYSRMQDKAVVESKAKFAAQVGEEMFKLAEDLAKFKSDSNSLIELNDAKEVLGLKAPATEYSADEIIKQIDLQEWTLNDMGFFSKNGVTYILKSPLHACLIVRKIEHIEAEIKRLMLSNHYLVPRAIAQYIMLKNILLGFPEALIAKGLETYSKAKFTFPSLVVSLGGFE